MRGKWFILREAKPLFISPCSRIVIKGVLEGLRPSLTYLPLPLLREGGQGDRLLNELLVRLYVV